MVCTWWAYNDREEGSVAKARIDRGRIMGRSPAAARRRLGNELRRLRIAAGKRIEDAAKALDCSTAKISRLEGGKGIPYARDVRDLFHLYGSNGDLTHLMELAEEGRAQDWFDDYKDVIEGDMFGAHQERYASLERDAAVIRWYEHELIPGLLQSEEYVDSVARAVHPNRPDKERQRFVEFRMQRQEAVLRRAAQSSLGFAVGELAILRSMSDTHVLRRQLQALAANLEDSLKYIEFHITPLSLDDPAVFGGPFIVLQFPDPTDQDVVYQEGRDGATYLESDDEVERYLQKFRSIAESSMSRELSVDYLRQKAKQLD
jgi:transcriptional regulator with XRE-family HTH domain